MPHIFDFANYSGNAFKCIKCNKYYHEIRSVKIKFSDNLTLIHPNNDAIPCITDEEWIIKQLIE